MKKILLSCCILLSSILLFAQNDTASISGRLVDTASKQLLQGASINLIKARDSLQNRTILSGKDGSFSIKNITAGSYSLFINFSGYETIQIRCRLSADTMNLRLGNIYMTLKGNDLQTVVVTSSPIVIKKDTVVYNAGSFSTKPDANVEDLLKKLPGVDVDQSGNIKAQGETVQRVLVNGKRFFGDDPKMATQNLPPDVVDRIEVFDDLSDQSAFTGFDDGNRVKTINIVTKKNKNKGYFGKATVGAGNKGLYECGISANRFNDNQQITLIAQGNNTNQQLFTVQDILGTSGGGTKGYAGGQGGGGSRGNSAGTGGGPGGGGSSRGFVQGITGQSGSNGITTTWAAGLNYRDNWGKNTTVSGSYFYNNLLVQQMQQSLTQNLFTSDSSTFNNANLNGSNRNVNQRLNLNVETQFDSSNSMVIRPNVSYQTASVNSQTTTNITDENAKQLSNSTANTSSNNNGYNGSVDALFRHKFKKTGRTFSIDENISSNKNDATGFNFSNVTDSAGLTKTNQYYTSKTNGYGFSTTLSYTEPLGKNHLLQFTYNNSYTKNNADRSTYNYDSASGKYIDVDSLLTNSYENTYTSNRGEIDYLIKTAKLNMSFGSGVQFGHLTSFNETKDSSLSHNFTNIYPTANLSYRISSSKNLRINYSGRTTQPSVQQLQPVTDNSDPLNIKLGNPDLKQEFTNSLRILYTSFDRVHFRNVFASINASVISNDIVNSTNVLSNGAQIIQPVNLNGAYSLSGFFNYGFPINKPKMNLNFTTNLSYNQTVSLVNAAKNTTKNTALGESFKLTTNLKKNFDLNFSYTPTYNIANYSLQPSENANYYSQTLSIEPTINSNSGWIFSSTFNYTSYTGRSAGYNTSVPLWNAYVAKKFLKNKSGELRFFVFDLLNENKSITRTVTENYIQDVQTKVLTRYFLVSFIYNLRKFGAQMPSMFGRKNPEGNEPPPPPPQNNNNASPNMPPPPGGNEGGAPPPQ